MDYKIRLKRSDILALFLAACTMVSLFTVVLSKENTGCSISNEKAAAICEAVQGG